jgi:hypothetical protein
MLPDFEFWDQYYLPEQNDRDDVEIINPAEAFRKQAVSVNLSGPIYAELEVVEAQLRRVQRAEAELQRRILAQQMDDLKGTQTRTNELVDAYVLSAAENFQLEGRIRDVRRFVLRWRRRADRLQGRKALLERRLRALSSLAEICENVLNWDKHQARLELAGLVRR